MAQTAGIKTSYGDTTPHKRAIGNLINIISPTEVPAVKYFGLDNASKFRLVNWPHTKVEWLEDDLLGLSQQLAASATSDTTAISVTAAAGGKFRAGQIILVDLEYMWVSAVSTDTLTVTRAVGGTQATHASTAVVYVRTNARLEGQASTDGSWVDITAPYNYTEIYQDEIKVSRTQRKLQQYGIADEFDHQTAKKFKEQMRLLNQAFYDGQRLAGSTTTPRAFGGLDTFITDNTSTMSTAPLTRDALEDAIQSAWSDGGSPAVIFCDGSAKRKISSFYEPAVRTTRDESRGGVVISEIETEFGSLSVVMDRWCPAAKLYILDPQYVGFLTYDEMSFEELAKDGDYDKGQIVGEYSLVVANDKAHASIAGMSN